MFAQYAGRNLEAFETLEKVVPPKLAEKIIDLAVWTKSGSIEIPTASFIKAQNFFVKKNGEGMDAKILGYMHELNVHGDCTCGKNCSADFLHWLLYQSMMAWYNHEGNITIPQKFFAIMKEKEHEKCV